MKVKILIAIISFFMGAAAMSTYDTNKPIAVMPKIVMVKVTPTPTPTLLPTPTPKVIYQTQTKYIYAGCPPNYTLLPSTGKCVNAYGL